MIENNMCTRLVISHSVSSWWNLNGNKIFTWELENFWSFKNAIYLNSIYSGCLNIAAPVGCSKIFGGCRSVAQILQNIRPTTTKDLFCKHPKTTFPLLIFKLKMS